MQPRGKVQYCVQNNSYSRWPSKVQAGQSVTWSPQPLFPLQYQRRRSGNSIIIDNCRYFVLKIPIEECLRNQLQVSNSLPSISNVEMKPETLDFGDQLSYINMRSVVLLMLPHHENLLLVLQRLRQTKEHSKFEAPSEDDSLIRLRQVQLHRIYKAENIR